MLRNTGALLMQERVMMAMPISLARRRKRHGLLRKGRLERQVEGVTSGEGSLDQAHWATLVRSGCWVIDDEEDAIIFLILQFEESDEEDYC